MADELIWESAVSLSEKIRNKELSARELMTSVLDRIDEINPKITAVVSLRDREELLAEADAADATEPKGPLHGIPHAIKDLADVAGLPTRSGSLTTSDQPVATDTLFVERMRNAGSIFIGKTNTPEFGAGSHTFNEVFGTTRNPHNLGRTAGGSSGGAGAALTTGMVPLADGSDLGGSLRNPAAWNGVVGFRPSLGAVPEVPTVSGFINDLAVSGPMARSVEDVAMLYSVMAGPDPRAPRSRLTPGGTFAPPLEGSLAGLRVAWAGELDLYWEPEAYQVPLDAMSVFSDNGASVGEAAPDLSDAMWIFRVFRGLLFHDKGTSVPAEVWQSMKQTLVENIQFGLDLTVEEVMRAEDARTKLHLNVVEFFETHDVLALPTTQVAPFPVEVEFPTDISGAPMEDYLSWMTSCCLITPTGCPAISMPCGTTTDGMPLGVQLIAAPGQDRKLLEIAHAFEAAAPPAPRPDL